MEEKELIHRLKNSDESAMKLLFDAWHPRLCLIGYGILKDKDQAKDVVQEVFIRLWRNRADLQIDSVGPYLKRAVVNTALNYVESAGRLRREELEKSHMVAAPPAELDIGYRELRDHVQEAIARLPLRTRTVFTLIRSQEMSYKEVASSLNISVRAVEKEMMKALRLLRVELKDFLNPLIWLVFFCHL
jgi:RNA polymerase sigma-70 factor (family 1)